MLKNKTKASRKRTIPGSLPSGAPKRSKVDRYADEEARWQRDFVRDLTGDAKRQVDCLQEIAREVLGHPLVLEGDPFIEEDDDWTFCFAWYFKPCITDDLFDRLKDALTERDCEMVLRSTSMVELFATYSDDIVERQLEPLVAFSYPSMDSLPAIIMNEWNKQ